MTNSIGDLEDAECILIIGSNTTEQHPLIAHHILRAKEKGAKLILADPRMIMWARVADLHLRHRLGTDVALLNGMMNVILSEGLEAKEFIKQRTEGFESLKATVARYVPEHVEKLTGVPQQLIVEAARTFAGAKASALVYAMGITQHTTGVDNVMSCANLAMLTGNFGRPGTGVNPLRGQVNVQGACDVGALPNVFPGYQPVADEAIRKKFEEAWHTSLPPKPGITLTDMMTQAASGTLKAMYVMGENPMVSDPDLTHVEKALRNLEFLVVQDIFMTETARLADVVLPAASFAERDGTVTSTDRVIRLFHKAIEPIGESRPDWQIICDLARRMGSKEFEYSSASQIMDEMARLTPSYGGISHDRLKSTFGIPWPCPTKEHPGTPILHKDKFARGLGRLTAIEFKEPAELPDKPYPLTLTTGRLIFHYHTGTMTRRTEILNHEVPVGYVEINPGDAAALCIEEGEVISVSSRRGSITISARITDWVERGVVFIPFHFVESAANVLTNPVFDPVAKIPEYKVCSCRIEKVTPTTA